MMSLFNLCRCMVQRHSIIPPLLKRIRSSSFLTTKQLIFPNRYFCCFTKLDIAGSMIFLEKSLTRKLLRRMDLNAKILNWRRGNWRVSFWKNLLTFTIIVMKRFCRGLTNLRRNRSKVILIIPKVDIQILILYIVSQIINLIWVGVNL